MAEVLDCFHSEKECVRAFIHTHECFGVELDKVVNTGVFFQTNHFVEYIKVCEVKKINGGGFEL